VSQLLLYYSPLNGDKISDRWIFGRQCREGAKTSIHPFLRAQGLYSMYLLLQMMSCEAPSLLPV
jgi:hypothetical protein